MQLFRILQSQGLGSRRECLMMIRRQQVQVDGLTITDPEQEFSCDALSFSVAGVAFEYRKHAYLAMHKPAGYECSHQPRDHPSVFSLLPQYLLRRGLQCVGRLDQDTTGLLLFSDDGRFIHDQTAPKKAIGKTYLVTCKHAFSSNLVEQLLAGVQLHDEPLPLRARYCMGVNEKQLLLTINEGKYHQVKRMLAAAGNRVEFLHRSAIGQYSLENELAPGSWKWLDQIALDQLSTTLAL